MKNRLSLIIATAAALVCFFSCKSSEDRPSWVQGRWIGENVSFMFRDTTLTMNYNDRNFRLGGFHVESNGQVTTYGTPVGLKVNPALKTITFVETGELLKKITRKNYPKEYSWVPGKWSDPAITVKLTLTDIELWKFGKLEATGEYTIGDGVLLVAWDDNYVTKEKFKINSQRQRIEYSYHILSK